MLVTVDVFLQITTINGESFDFHDKCCFEVIQSYEGFRDLWRIDSWIAQMIDCENRLPGVVIQSYNYTVLRKEEKIKP